MSAVPRPHARRERLSSLKDAGKSRPVGTLPPRNRPKRPTCCSDPNIQDIDGSQVCANCGAMISESNIVAEVTFGETSAGAAMVVGGSVGEDQRFANTMGAAGRRLGVGGGESKSTSAQNGRDAIRGLMTSLRIFNEDTEKRANRIYDLAIKESFVHGRRPIVVAACALYYTSRSAPGNKLLLIDFAEKIKLNVFKLGETYKALLGKIFLNEPGSQDMYTILEPEPLIQKYVQKLEFGDVGGRRVAEDAVKILRRMKRDWMVEGRQPAGICGACILLAARMNNFRRTVREVVYVVKVADMTIAKRLIEFKRTQSGRLTVDQFRRLGNKLQEEKEPPSVYQAREREAKRRRLMALENHADYATVVSDAGSRETSVAPPAPRQPRRDADGFVIPDRPELPIDPSLLAASNLAIEELLGSGDAGSPPKKKPGRPSKKKKEEIMPLSDEDLLVEQEIEEEIERVLHDPDVVNNMDDSHFTLIQARARAISMQQQEGTQKTNEEPTVDEHEFDDDPEVANCLLSPAEIAIKERIWVTHNEDWLRAQQAKMLKKALEEANGGPKKKQTRKRKHHQIGDVSGLEGDSPIASPADAAQRMLQRRGKGFSKNINYEKLNAIMRVAEENGKEKTTSVSTSQYSSARPSAAASPAPTDVTEEIIEEEIIEEKEEPQARAGAASRSGGVGLATPPATQQASQRGATSGDPEVIEEDEGDDEEEEEEEDEEEPQEEDTYATALDPLNFNPENEYNEEYEGEEYE